MKRNSTIDDVARAAGVARVTVSRVLNNGENVRSTYGYYLEALTIFAAVTHTDPRELGQGEKAARDLGVDGNTAAKLQEVASDAIKISHC